jgi:CO dehydrogenase maturation factor
MNKNNYLIAITGKGGVGKTTLAAMLLRQLIARGKTPVLAVDADPNMCLNIALGVPVSQTVGGIREQAREIAGKGMSTGIAKQELLEMKIAESLVESDNFDLIAMGRPEGPGCYCYANNVLKSVLGEVAGQYPYVVLDNEAGLENLSRRIVQQVNLLIIVADPSHQGLETIMRIHNLAAEMNIKYDHLAVFINRVRSARAGQLLNKIKTDTQADSLLLFPDDDEIAAFSEAGISLLQLSKENSVALMLDRFLQDINL